MTSLVVHFCSAPLVCFVDALDMGLSHLPAVMSSGSSAPAALRSWAIPTLGEWALKPSPRPAIFVAALILREIWPADSLNTLAPGSITASKFPWFFQTERTWPNSTSSS